ncbi:hypothetical protein, partial [Aeromonas salmonicida]|uniref:hypothetical protein n=1 Tax=Aeromonas salmonicida TaxID=645 RepID=UPI003CEA66FA
SGTVPNSDHVIRQLTCPINGVHFTGAAFLFLMNKEICSGPIAMLKAVTSRDGSCDANTGHS